MSANQVIPEAAVEAALSSIVGGNEATGPDIAGDFLTREQLRAVLEAAAPHLIQAAKAEAWGEGYDAADYDAPHSIKTPNPYR